MGGSSWNDKFYSDRVETRALHNIPTFEHDDAVKKGVVEPKVHDSLNPFGVTRESRDSDAHPQSTAIGVMFDVTGSMHGVPRVLQQKLPQLMGLLLRKGYIRDPQILFGAVGDVFSDKASLQVGQFESGIEMEDDLTRIYLEGGGGGSREESYQNAIWFFANHTSCDCWEKRGKKGYLFLIGDEKPYPHATKDELARVFGDSVQANIMTEEIVRQASEKWEIFFIMPQGTSHYGQTWLRERWEKLLNPQHVLVLDSAEAVCEVIGLTIGLLEGSATGDSMAADLADVGVGHAIVRSATDALDSLAKSTGITRVTADGDLPATTGRSSDVNRL